MSPKQSKQFRHYHKPLCETTYYKNEFFSLKTKAATNEIFKASFFFFFFGFR